MNHHLKATVFFMLFVLPMGGLFAQTSSGVDADSRFIAIGVNGWQDAYPLYGGADSYFSTNSMRDLGPDGDYSNIAAYHLIGSPSADGKDYIRQIGDFNSSFDTYYKAGGQDGLALGDQDKDSEHRELVSNNQPFISMAKVEWVYRNTIDGEFLSGLTDKSLAGIARAVDVMISDGPQYKDLLSVGSPQKALDYIRRIRNGETLSAATIFGNEEFTNSDLFKAVRDKLNIAVGKMGGTGQDVVPNSWQPPQNSNYSANTLLVALWLTAWDCPNTIRFFTHSMGGTDVLRYLSEPETKYDPQAHDGGLYQRNQDYTRDKFVQDLGLNSETNLCSVSGTGSTWASRTDLSGDDKYAIYKKERQNSVDKVIALDGPLAGTPTSELVSAASILLNEQDFINFKTAVADASVTNILLSTIEIGYGVAILPFLPPVGYALISDGLYCIVVDAAYLVVDFNWLLWDSTKNVPKIFTYDIPLPASLDAFPKQTDKFFPDTFPGSAHVGTYANAPPPTSYSNWPDRMGFKNEPVEFVNVVVTGPATYTKNPSILGLSEGIALGVYQRKLLVKLPSAVLGALEVFLAVSDSGGDNPSWLETALPILWSLFDVDYEPGTFLTTKSYSTGIGSHGVGPIANNPNSSVFELDTTTAGYQTNSTQYGDGFPSRDVWNNQATSGDFFKNAFLGIHPWDAMLLSRSILLGDDFRFLLKSSDLDTSHGGGISTLTYSWKSLKTSNRNTAVPGFPLEKDSDSVKRRNFYDYLMFGPPDVSTSLSMKLVTDYQIDGKPAFGNVLEQVDADPSGDPLKGLKSTYVVSASDVGAHDYLAGLADAIYNNEVKVLPVDIVNYHPGVNVAFSINGSDFVDGQLFAATDGVPSLNALGTSYQDTLAPSPILKTDPANGRSLLISPRFKEGFNEVVYRFTDVFGDVSYKDMQIVQITVPPFVKPVYPLMNQYVAGGTVHAQVQALDISGGTIKPQDWLTKATFNIAVDGNSVYGYNVDRASGTVSFDLVGLSDGNHTVDFTVTTYGVTNRQSWRFWVDSSAPMITFSSPSIFSNTSQTNNGNVGFFVNDAVPFRSGSLNYPVDTVQLANLNVSVDGQSIWAGNNVRLGNYIEPWNGWNAYSQLSTGRYPVTVTATDRVGNTTTQTGEVIVDNQAPSFTKCSLNTNTVTLTTGLLQLDYQLALNDWETTGKLELKIHNLSTNEDFTLTTDSDGQNEQQYALTYFSQGVNSLRDGVYDISVTAVDPIGNRSAPIYFNNIVVDRTAPVVTNALAAPFELDAPNRHVDLSFSASESADTSENRSSVLDVDIVVTDANGDPVASIPETKTSIGSTLGTPAQFGFDLPMDLADGQYVFVVKVSDHNGNTSEEDLPVVLDAVPPLITSPDQNALIDTVVALRGTITNPKLSNSLPFDHYEVWWQPGSLPLPQSLSNLSSAGWSSAGISVPDFEQGSGGNPNWGLFAVQAGNVFASFDTTTVSNGLVTVLVIAVQQGGYRIGTVRNFRVLHGSMDETVAVQLNLPATGTTLNTQPTAENPTPQITIPYSVTHDLANPVDVYASVLDASGRVVKQSTFLNLSSTEVMGRPQSFNASGLYIYEDASDGRFHLVFNNVGSNALQSVITVTSTAISNVTDGANQPLSQPALVTNGNQLVLSESVAAGTSQEVAFQVPSGSAIQVFASGLTGTIPTFVGPSAALQPSATTLTLYAGSNYPPFVWDGTDQFGSVVVNGTYTVSVEAYGKLAGHDLKTVAVTLTSPFVVDQVTLDTNTIQTGVSALSQVNGRFHANKPGSFQILVLNSSGNQVNVATASPATLDNAGFVNFSWGAVDSSNALVPAGTYSFVILATPTDTGIPVRFDSVSIPALGNLQVVLGQAVDASLPASLSVSGDSTYNGTSVVKGNTDYQVRVTPKGQYLPDATVAMTLDGTGTQVVQAYPQLNYQAAIRKNYRELWSRLSADSAHIQVRYYHPSGSGYSSTTQHSDYSLPITQANYTDAQVVTYDINSNSISDHDVGFTIQATGQITIKDNYETKIGEYWDFGTHDITGHMTYDGISAIDSTAGHIVYGAYGDPYSNFAFTSIQVLSDTTLGTTDSTRTLSITVQITGHIWSNMNLSKYLSYADGIAVAGPDCPPSASRGTIKTNYVDALNPMVLGNFVTSDAQLNSSFGGSDVTADCWRLTPSYYFYYLGEDYQNVTSSTSPNLTGVPRQTPQTYNPAVIASAPRSLVNPGATFTTSNGKVSFVLGPSAGSEFGVTVTSSAEDRILYPYPANSSGFSIGHQIGDTTLNIPTANINSSRTSNSSSAIPDYTVPEWLNGVQVGTRNVWFTEQNSSIIAVSKALTYADGVGYQTSPVTLADVTTASLGLPATVNVKRWKITNAADPQGHVSFSGLVGNELANDSTYVPFTITDTNITQVDNAVWDLTMDANAHTAALSTPFLTPNLDDLNRYGRLKSLYFTDLYPYPTVTSSNPKDMFWGGAAASHSDNTSVVIPGKKDYSGAGIVGGYTVDLFGIDGQPYQGLTTQTPTALGKGLKLSDGVVVALGTQTLRSFVAIRGSAASSFDLSYLVHGQWQSIPIDGSDPNAGILTYWDVTSLNGMQTLRLISHGTSTVNIAFTNVYIGTQVSDSSNGTNVSSPSGKANITFPAGSLSSSSVVSIDSLNPQDVKDVAVLPAFAPIGKIVKLSPEGMTFPNQKPVLQFTYNKSDIDELHIDPLQLVIYQLKDDGTLVPTPTIALFVKVDIDPAGNPVSESVVWDSSQQNPAQFPSGLDYTYARVYTTLNHFSYYAVYEGDVNRRPMFDQTDFLTNQTKVTISGKADAGSSVNLYVQHDASLNVSDPNVRPDATVMAGSDGKFSTSDFAVPFEGDDFVFAVYATGTAAQYSKLKVSRDTTSPLVSTSAYINKLSPKSTGTQKATTVHVSSNEQGWLRWNIQGPNGQNVIVGSQEVPANGTISIVLNGLDAYGNQLPDGDYKLTLVAVDAAGNLSIPSVLPFTISTVPASFVCMVPTPKISPANQDGYLDHEAFQLTLSKNATVSLWVGSTLVPKLRQLRNQTSMSAGSISVDWDGKDDAGTLVPDGNYFLTVYAQDAFGNETAVSLNQNLVAVVNTPPKASLSLKSGDTFIIPAGARFTMQLNEPALTDLVIRDSQGAVVFESKGTLASGENSFAWDTAALSPGTYTVSGTATDDLQNIGAIGPTAISLQEDTIPPSIVLQDEIVIEASAVETPYTVPTPTIVDSLSPVTVTSDAPAAFPLGTTIVTWTATDPYGLSSTQTQKITVRDTTAPIYTKLPEPIIIKTTSIHAFVDVGSLQSGAVAVYDIFPVSVANDSPGEFFTGTTLVKWTATDVNGNVNTVYQPVSIVKPDGDTIADPWFDEDLGQDVHGFAAFDGSRYQITGSGQGVLAPNQTKFHFSVASRTRDGYIGNLTLKNISGSEIHDWMLDVLLPAHGGNGNPRYPADNAITIRSSGDNGDILPGQSIAVSFQVRGNDTPTAVVLNGVPSIESISDPQAPTNSTEAFVQQVENRAGRYTAVLTVTNTSNAPIDGWALKFDFPGSEKVLQGSGATFAQAGKSVTLSSVSSTRHIGVQETVTISLQVQGSGLPDQNTIFVNGEKTKDAAEIEDGFHFVYQKASGDTSITIKVGPSNTEKLGTQAVILLRDKLTPDSAMVAISANSEDTDAPQGGSSRGNMVIESSWRLPNSEVLTSQEMQIANGPYLRLARVNNTYTLYASTDGKSWMKVGDPIVVPTSGFDYIGFGGRSVDTRSAVQIEAAQVSASHPSSGDLVNGWKHQDVGAVTQPGWAEFDGKNANVRGSGYGTLVPGLCHVDVIKDSADGNGYSGRFIVTNISPITVPDWELAFVFPSDEIISHVQHGQVSQDGRDVVIRSPGPEELRPNESVEIAFQVTGTEDPFGFLVNGIPCALGDNGQVQSLNKTVSSVTKLDSDRNGYRAILAFRNVSSLPINDWTLSFDFPGGEKVSSSLGNHIVQTGTHVVVKSSSQNAKLDPGASVSVELIVKGSGLPGNITVNGVPSGNALLFDDATHLVYRPLVGDGALVVKVLPYQMTPGSQSQLTMRSDLTGISPMVSLSVVGAAQERNGWFDRGHQTITAYFSFRDNNAAGFIGNPVTIDIGQIKIGDPLYLKLLRKGNLYTGYYSFDGNRWMQVGSPYTAIFGDSGYIAFGGSGPDSVYDSTTFGQVSLAGN